MNKTERSTNFFSQGYACSQAVLLAFAEELGLSPELAARVAAGFGGGMGRAGKTCGVVTGGIMVIGLRHSGAPDAEAKASVYADVRRFMAAFAARHGTTDCIGLLECDISTPEGHELARSQGLYKSRCPLFVRDAAEILGEL
jgi:C_GCAxxG_C_C family probable redox protein